MVFYALRINKEGSTLSRSLIIELLKRSIPKVRFDCTLLYAFLEGVASVEETSRLQHATPNFKRAFKWFALMEHFDQCSECLQEPIFLIPVFQGDRTALAAAARKGAESLSEKVKYLKRIDPSGLLRKTEKYVLELSKITDDDDDMLNVDNPFNMFQAHNLSNTISKTKFDSLFTGVNLTETYERNKIKIDRTKTFEVRLDGETVEYLVVASKGNFFCKSDNDYGEASRAACVQLSATANVYRREERMLRKMVVELPEAEPSKKRKEPAQAEVIDVDAPSKKLEAVVQPVAPAAAAPEAAAPEAAAPAAAAPAAAPAPLETLQFVFGGGFTINMKPGPFNFQSRKTDYVISQGTAVLPPTSFYTASLDASEKEAQLIQNGYALFSIKYKGSVSCTQTGDSIVVVIGK